MLSRLDWEQKLKRNIEQAITAKFEGREDTFETALDAICYNLSNPPLRLR